MCYGFDFILRFLFLPVRLILFRKGHIETVQQMKFPIKDFFSKCDQIRRKLRIWPHLLEKSSMENIIKRSSPNFASNIISKFDQICKLLFHLRSPDAINFSLKDCRMELASIISRSSHPEIFLRKGVLKKCNKFTGEHPC